MTENEWLECDDPIAMTEVLRLSGKGSDRKLRLFIAEGVRVLASIFGKDGEELSEMHERVAEGQAVEEDLERLLLKNMPDLWEHRAPGGNLPGIWPAARMLIRDRVKLTPLAKGEEDTAETWEESRDRENADMCIMLRCIFGSPFQALKLEPSWLTSTVTTLACAGYNERILPAGTLDPDRLAILADALEDAGCTDVAILEHLRGPGPHVRGCWVLDLLLAKN